MKEVTFENIVINKTKLNDEQAMTIHVALFCLKENLQHLDIELQAKYLRNLKEIDDVMIKTEELL